MHKFWLGCDFFQGESFQLSDYSRVNNVIISEHLIS